MNLANLYFIHFGISAFSIIFGLKSNLFMRNLIIIYLFFVLLASRQFEYKQDLLSYYNWAIWDFYTYREPVFPYLNSLSYKILGWRNIYIISDTISLIIIGSIFQRLKLHYNYMLIFFCFFPVIMGFQSIYRQFFGSLICLYIISFSYDASIQNNIIFKRIGDFIRALIAIGTHNVHFLSILTFKFINLKYILNFLCSVVIGTLIVLIYDLLGKSNHDSGSSTTILYIITLIILFSCFYFNRDKIGCNLCLSGITIITIMWFRGLETPSERVGLSFLIFIYISLVYYIDRFRPYMAGRLILLCLGFFPLFMTSAQTLLTGSYLNN